MCVCVCVLRGKTGQYVYIYILRDAQTVSLGDKTLLFSRKNGKSETGGR